MSVTVTCALRSGGDYDRLYVDWLCRQVHKHTAGYPINWHPFTDLDDGDADIDDDRLVSWWCKLKCFTLKGPVLYLDLDTYIAEPLHGLLDAIEGHPGRFWALRPFKPAQELASGVMAWNGDYSWIYEELTPGHISGWDQMYINQMLKNHGKPFNRIQDTVKVASYKHHCKDGIPEGTDIVCFHGKPRPHEIGAPFFPEKRQ